MTPDLLSLVGEPWHRWDMGSGRPLLALFWTGFWALLLLLFLGTAYLRHRERSSGHWTGGAGGRLQPPQLPGLLERQRSVSPARFEPTDRSVPGMLASDAERDDSI